MFVSGKVYQWRTQNGVDVPVVIESRLDRLGFVATLSEEPAPKTLGSAQSFLKKFPGSKVVIAYGVLRWSIKRLRCSGSLTGCCVGPLSFDPLHRKVFVVTALEIRAAAAGPQFDNTRGEAANKFSIVRYED
jgi:hypothetical protein